MGTRKLPRKPDRMPGRGGGGFDTLNGQHPIQHFSSFLIISHHCFMIHKPGLAPNGMDLLLLEKT